MINAAIGQSAPANLQLVFVIDSDALVLEAISFALSVQGFRVRSFANFDSFLAGSRHEPPACTILDVNLSNPSSLVALQKLHTTNGRSPIIAVSAYADIPLAVKVMKSGAADFILKPFDAKQLAARVAETITQSELAQRQNSKQLANSIFNRLTKRERDVLHYLVHGMTNSEIGQRLGISSRTVEVHRINTMHKLKVRNVVGLVRLVNAEGVAA